jgi:sodium-coupled monocarboxylate transporter 8/12
MRFSSYVRTYGAAMYMFQMILYTSVAVYAPALALSHGKCQNICLSLHRDQPESPKF